VIIPIPSAPTGNTSQTFCSGATVANLSATGAAIKWYSVSTGGTELAPTINLVNTNHYYATQTTNGCESTTRLNVTAIVNYTDSPNALTTQKFCMEAKVSDLEVTGTAIKWYSSIDGDTLLMPTTSLVNGMYYYATQTVNGCESQGRAYVLAVINTIIPSAPTGNTTQTFCSGATVANLLATGTEIKWYNTPIGDTLLLPTAILVDGTHYYASQIIDGCESSARLDVTTIINSILIVNHTAGWGVAPVTKTVSYGLVNTKLFGGNKCAITQNLGADVQASSANDDTETAAGWYWQFSRIQGYRYGGTRTPSTTWGSSISENNNWLSTNDPCEYLLGANWRLPTNTEWQNAKNGWIYLNSPYESVLKLHAAGYLSGYSGLLDYRGLEGKYWSSTHSNSTNASFLDISGSSSSLYSGAKTYGYSVRCIKD